MLDLVWTSQPSVFEAFYMIVAPVDRLVDDPELEDEPMDPEIGWTTTLDGGW